MLYDRTRPQRAPDGLHQAACFTAARPASNGVASGRILPAVCRQRLRLAGTLRSATVYHRDIAMTMVWSSGRGCAGRRSFPPLKLQTSRELKSFPTGEEKQQSGLVDRPV